MDVYNVPDAVTCDQAIFFFPAKKKKKKSPDRRLLMLFLPRRKWSKPVCVKTWSWIRTWGTGLYYNGQEPRAPERLRRQISLDYHTIPPATQAKLEETSSGLASFRSSRPRAATACRDGKKEERLGLGAERGKIIFLANS